MILDVNVIHDWFDWLTILVPILISVIYTNIQISKQEKQWKYDTIIKNEMQVLIDFREQYHNSNFDIQWFMHDFLSPHGDYPCIFHNKENEVFRRDYFIQCWLRINEVNNLLNKNLYIFGKYKLAAKIQFIRLLLELRCFLPTNGDFTIEYQENSQQYRLQDFNKIKLKFVKEAHELLIKTNIIKDYKITDTKNLLNSYTYIWSKVNDIFINLENDICPIAEDIELNEKEKVGCMIFYPHNMDINNNDKQ